jgi:hypothetical protein
VKEALFAAGAGAIGLYQACAWQTLGQGQFYAKSDANPSIGEIEKHSKVEEYRVELVLKSDLKDRVEQALLTHHPYETPAYYFIETL